jgi:type IX secretion system substrate protein
LPDSISNEPESHGYVIFEVEPLPALPNGTQITNDVGIYFDFNPPIYTNTVLNTISNGYINTSVTTAGVNITAAYPGGIYQWINCSTGDSISGETNQSYTATINGSYAVIVSDGCFADTSACVSINTLGINDPDNNSMFSVSPNPSQNRITITTTYPTELFIYNILGEVVLRSEVQNRSLIDVSSLDAGIYFIKDPEGNTIKFIKQ